VLASQLFAGSVSPVKRRFINATHLIVNKQAGQQNCQGEDLRAVLSSLQAASTASYIILNYKGRPAIQQRFDFGNCP